MPEYTRKPPPWKWWKPPLPQAAAGVEAVSETVPSAATAAAARTSLRIMVVSPVGLDAPLHPHARQSRGAPKRFTGGSQEVHEPIWDNPAKAAGGCENAQ